MKLLLDTGPFVWILNGQDPLSQRAAELFREPNNEVFVSTVSCWEIAGAVQRGQLEFPEDPVSYLATQRRRHRIELLSLNEEAAIAIHRLPVLHEDVFDRLLVSQAIADGLSVVTPDPRIQQYEVRTVW